MFALVLAATLAPVATAAPQPRPALEQLKTIVHLRATPFCSALRERVAPAIEHILTADKAIDSSPPIFNSMYEDDVVFRSPLRLSFDVQHMENLITPIVSNVQAAEDLLRDPQLGEIGRQLQTSIDRQKLALNVVNGFIATYQLGEVQSGGIPANWHNDFILNPRNAVSRSPAAVAASPPGASLLYNAGLAPTPSNPRPPELQASTVTLGVDPYAAFSQTVVRARQEGDAAEGAASLAIFAAIERCRQ